MRVEDNKAKLTARSEDVDSDHSQGEPPLAGIRRLIRRLDEDRVPSLENRALGDGDHAGDLVHHKRRRSARRVARLLQPVSHHAIGP